MHACCCCCCCHRCCPSPPAGCRVLPTKATTLQTSATVIVDYNWDAYEDDFYAPNACQECLDTHDAGALPFFEEQAFLHNCGACLAPPSYGLPASTSCHGTSRANIWPRMCKLRGLRCTLNKRHAIQQSPRLTALTAAKASTRLMLCGGSLGHRRVQCQLNHCTSTGRLLMPKAAPVRRVNLHLTGVLHS